MDYVGCGGQVFLLCEMGSEMLDVFVEQLCMVIMVVGVIIDNVLVGIECLKFVDQIKV